MKEWQRNYTPVKPILKYYIRKSLKIDRPLEEINYL